MSGDGRSPTCPDVNVPMNERNNMSNSVSAWAQSRLIRLTTDRLDSLERKRQRGRARSLLTDDTGAATAEYAIATMAAVAFAGLLVMIMRSDEIKQVLTDMVKRALTIP